MRFNAYSIDMEIETNKKRKNKMERNFVEEMKELMSEFDNEFMTHEQYNYKVIILDDEWRDYLISIGQNEEV